MWENKNLKFNLYILQLIIQQQLCLLLILRSLVTGIDASWQFLVSGQPFGCLRRSRWAHNAVTDSAGGPTYAVGVGSFLSCAATAVHCAATVGVVGPTSGFSARWLDSDRRRCKCKNVNWTGEVLPCVKRGQRSSDFKSETFGG